MNSTETCRDDSQRRRDIRRHTDAEGRPDLNGIDYLEVSDDQRTLTVHFLRRAPQDLEIGNLRIDGGRRVRDVSVVAMHLCEQADPELDDCLVLTVDQPGDFSTYTLSIVEADRYGRPTRQPRRGFDPRYARLDFSFKVNCPTDLDCAVVDACPPAPLSEPEINYLAKDYAGFRQLILDRLAVVMPDWKERHVPDIGIALVEALAYVGDYLSYYQDAVATEAYLDTARQRISVRRHARLVDYRLHEGCNARAWVCIETEDDLPALALDAFYLITPYDGLLFQPGIALTVDDLRSVPTAAYETFQPLQIDNRDTFTFIKAHNAIPLYTWGERECCLPRGATEATLRDEWREAAENDSNRALNLTVGDILLFEEIVGPRTGEPGDADPAHRHAVCLTEVRADVDPLYNVPVVEIAWAREDALPFPLCLSAIGEAPGCVYREQISVARGNVLLCEHGRSVEETLPAVPADRTPAGPCEAPGRPAPVTPVRARYRPTLKQGPLSFHEPPRHRGPAARLLDQDPRRAAPQITISGTTVDPGNWTSEPDLLDSAPAGRHFVAEINDQGHAQLRFGDDELGRAPRPGTRLMALYRVGNGPAGNVGAETITRIVLKSGADRPRIIARNPLPARGGQAPEPLAEAKLLAPGAFRKVLERAITADDYAQIAGETPGVQRAAATLRWTGSEYAVRVAVDPLGSERADDRLLSAVERRLHRYRRIGHDLEVVPATYVPIDLALTICVQPHYLRGHVERALRNLFSNRVLPDGTRGLFHPDGLTFGDSIYLSRLVGAAMGVEGVESATVTRLERLNEGPNAEIENGLLPLGPLEIARLDNDPRYPENGKLTLIVEGGR